MTCVCEKVKGKLSLKCKALLGALALKDKEIIMIDMCIGNEKGSLRSKVLLGALALAVMVGLGTGVYAASANKSADNSLSGQTGVFNPFTLQRTRLPETPSIRGSESNLASDLIDLRPVILSKMIKRLSTLMPTIIIPSRPILRSCFRPDLMLRP